ncbi:MAG: restriction endonuclease subunit S [Vicingaceae bacterium]
MEEDKPESWELTPLKELASEEKHSFIDGDWIESPYITKEGVRLIQTGNIGIGKFINKNKKYISDASFDELRCKEVFEGDVLICRLAEPIGRACIVPALDTRNITSVDVTIFRPKTDVDKYYIQEFLNFNPTLKFIESLSGGSTRQRINRTNLGKVKIALPPLPEQQKIAEILSSVDEKIEVIEERITQTQELKKGLMQQLLTKGIGHKEFKDSPLGEIPMSWEVAKIYELGIELIDGDRGTNYPKSDDFMDKGFCLFLSAKNVTKSGFKFDTLQFISEERDKLLNKGKLSRNDFIITTRGSVGHIALYDESVLYDHIRLNSGMVIIRDGTREFNSKFLYQLLNSILFKSQIEYITSGSAQPQLTIKGLNKLTLLIPPLSEQQKIAEILSSVDEKLEVLSTKKVNYQELKQGLMQQLLTGKIRVNNLIEKEVSA